MSWYLPHNKFHDEPPFDQNCINCRFCLLYVVYFDMVFHIDLNKELSYTNLY